ncbi:hypothetical protein AMAG_04521 [Allomyces macrogynus ATCC 38327]|uniref:FHA domain-containing protein n=1 Tax=Allomyces macrogynus (strain ATCC 38327) TaxID=578462 RepID=A0A0L0S5G2_ALLM3|nr:hypothetical protein AMAG_04521 [Allomyces macrogynus ATCC 38327]|eukprot:KNE57656.1 hypothetical protein AMAG_04521 [Allomyces macrogynus ATCC 38327]
MASSARTSAAAYAGAPPVPPVPPVPAAWLAQYAAANTAAPSASSPSPRPLALASVPTISLSPALASLAHMTPARASALAGRAPASSMSANAQPPPAAVTGALYYAPYAGLVLAAPSLPSLPPLLRLPLPGDGAVVTVGRLIEKRSSNVPAPMYTLDAPSPTTHRLRLKSKVISRHHARFFRAAGARYFVQDTRSSSGTFLNGRRLAAIGEDSAPVEVADGDLLQLGEDYDQNGVVHECLRFRIVLPPLPAEGEAAALAQPPQQQGPVDASPEVPPTTQTQRILPTAAATIPTSQGTSAPVAAAAAASEAAEAAAAAAPRRRGTTRSVVPGARSASMPPPTVPTNGSEIESVTIVNGTAPPPPTAPGTDTVPDPTGPSASALAAAETAAIWAHVLHISTFPTLTAPPPPPFVPEATPTPARPHLGTPAADDWVAAATALVDAPEAWISATARARAHTLVVARDRRVRALVMGLSGVVPDTAVATAIARLTEDERWPGAETVAVPVEGGEREEDGEEKRAGGEGGDGEGARS